MPAPDLFIPEFTGTLAREIAEMAEAKESVATSTMINGLVGV